MSERGLVNARILSGALLIGIFLLLLPFVAGLVGALVLLVVALPIMRRFDPHRSHRVVAFATVLLLFVLLVLPGAWLVADLLAQLPTALDQIQRSALVQRAMAMRIGELAVGTHLREASSAIFAWSSRQTMSAIAGVLSATLNLVIALFGAYYLLTSGDEAWRRVKSALPFPPATSEHLRRRFHRVTEAMLLGVVFTGATQGLLVGLTFAIVGLPQPLLWGAVTAVVSILPVFGSALVWLPGALVLAAQQRFAAAAVVAGIGMLVVSNVDNAVRMIVYRRVSQIHPMITLVGAFAGVKMFGLAGLLVGPLVLSYGVELIELQHVDSGAVLEAAA